MMLIIMVVVCFLGTNAIVFVAVGIHVVSL